MPNYNLSIRVAQVFCALVLASCGKADKPQIGSVLPDTTFAGIATNPLLAHSSSLPPATDSLLSDGKGRVHLGVLSWALPAEWTVAPPSGPMRVGELNLPGEGSFAVFRFGKGGGSVTSNLDRWRDQFTSRDTLWTETSSAPGFPVHLMVVEGTFEDGMGPHGVRDSAATKNGQALLGAIVEAPDGLVVFKAVLPKLAAHAVMADFRNMLATLRSEP